MSDSCRSGPSLGFRWGPVGSSLSVPSGSSGSGPRPVPPEAVPLCNRRKIGQLDRSHQHGAVRGPTSTGHRLPVRSPSRNERIRVGRPPGGRRRHTTVSTNTGQDDGGLRPCPGRCRRWSCRRDAAPSVGIPVTVGTCVVTLDTHGSPGGQLPPLPPPFTVRAEVLG